MRRARNRSLELRENCLVAPNACNGRSRSNQKKPDPKGDEGEREDTLEDSLHGARGSVNPFPGVCTRFRTNAGHSPRRRPPSPVALDDCVKSLPEATFSRDEKLGSL